MCSKKCLHIKFSGCVCVRPQVTRRIAKFQSEVKLNFKDTQRKTFFH